MAENKIELESINNLLKMKFFIPGYQRGYRWTQQQVKDLLNDIREFTIKSKDGFYCIQPLVVKVKNDDQWEVIDGQQRLTTIYILLKYLQQKEDNPKYYTIEYATRTDSQTFLESIDERQSEKNVDYYHIVEAKKQIERWFSENINKEVINFIDSNLPDKKTDFFDIILKGEKQKFLNTLLNNVKFIWYESIDEDPIKVFTRLNIGKISLTNAELIKALFLNKSNFQGSDNRIQLQQNKIAIEWDNIEYTLQNDEFWLFLNEVSYNKPTRIDFIFDLMCEQNTLGLTEDEKKELGTDEYKTFRYFYVWFNKQEKTDIDKCWHEVKNLFQIFQEWFNDLELYHYVGFLVECKTKLATILEKWNAANQTKAKFVADYILDKIKGKLNQCKDLDKQYEKGNPKTQCRPLLLLHNIQTIINQNQSLKDNEKYKLSVFYKFPFHLFKKEKWDVEHIDSNTENDLNSEDAKKQWLEYAKDYVSDEIKAQIAEYIDAGKDDEKPDFEKLKEDIYRELESKVESELKLSPDEKDQLWNFVLLDASTNRGYGNVIFPAKRKDIIAKDQSGTFIPPITRNVFSKYYNTNPNNLLIWDKNDATAYLLDIHKTLETFLH